jgi:hypothetical protein
LSTIGTERGTKKDQRIFPNGVDNPTQSDKLRTSKSEGLLEIVETSTTYGRKKQCHTLTIATIAESLLMFLRKDRAHNSLQCADLVGRLN